MKFRTKFLLSFMLIVLILVVFLTAYINSVMKERVYEDKSASYQMYLKQLVTSTGLITEEIERAVFNQYTDSGIAQIILSDSSTISKKLSIEQSLASFSFNVPSVCSVLVQMPDLQTCFATKVLSENAAIFSNVLTQDLHRRNTLWLRDAQGHIYLKKDLYQTFPLAYAGIIIARIDTNMLLSSLGISHSADGMLALLTEDGAVLAHTEDYDQTHLEAVLESYPLSYYAVSEPVVLDGKTWYYAMQPATDRSWYAVQLVSMEEMLQMPYELFKVIQLGSMLIIAFAFLISHLISHAVSRNVKELASSIAQVGKGNFETAIIVRSNDEIGELAKRFRWMQEELKQVTEENVRRATENQSIEYEMLELKYRSLQTQISPHFICNILSSINALTLMGYVDDVSRLSLRASRYLRENLQYVDIKYSSLDQEASFAQSYVDIYQEIYPSNCTFSIQLCDDSGECEVPSMLLQPLVENAMVHGFTQDVSDNLHTIKIVSEIVDKQLVIRVIDDGQGIPPKIIQRVERAEADPEYNKRMNGFGLRNVLQRLRILYGQNQYLSIESIPSVQTTITISIPYRIYQEP